MLSFGKIESVGGATNVIPNEVKLVGTFRTMDEAWRTEAHRLMVDMATAISRSAGGDCEFEVRKGYPSLINDAGLSEWAGNTLRDFLGEEKVEYLEPRMTAEDFAWFSQEVPGFFFRLGTGNPKKGIVSPVHTDTFDIDEDALKVGAGALAYLAMTRISSFS